MRRLLSIVLALGLVLSFSLVTAVPVMAFTEVWVDDVTNPSGDGSITNPFDSIQDGIDYVFLVDPVEGGIVHVLDGTYNENVSMRNGVAVLGAGASVTIIDAPPGHAVENNSVDSTTTIDGFTITGGIANFGGGIYNDGASPTVSNCIITGNTAANFGGGMYNFNGSSPVVVNCIITDNIVTNFHGGGIYADANSSPTITNCTIAGNTAPTGGGIYAENPTPTVTNTIIVRNTATTGGGIYVSAGTPALDYNDVWSNTGGNYGGVAAAGTHSISLDPLFGSGYHLQASSNCIDVGNNGAPSLPATDFDGEPRIFDGDTVPGAVVDIGADEYYVAPPPPPPSSTVGGEVYPIDKAALLLPWLISSVILILAAGGLILVRRLKPLSHR